MGVSRTYNYVITLAEKMQNDARVVFALLNIYAENAQGCDRGYGGGGLAGVKGFMLFMDLR